MAQLWETGTNSPDISCDFQLVLRGRLVAAPTDASLHKQQFLCVYGGAKNRPTDVRQFYGATKVCKPGSVLTAIYLAPQLLTGSSRLLGTVGQTFCPSTALLRDRVYIVKPMLPWAGCALTAPFHPCSADAGRYLSVALVLRFPSAGVTRYPCPVEPGLSSSGSFRFPSAAVQPSLRKYSNP